MSVTEHIGFEEYRNRFEETCKNHASDYVISSLMNNGRRVDLRYSKLLQMIYEFAPVKEKYGLRDGDRVLILTSPIADAFITFEILACNHLTVVIADPSLPREELSRLIEEVQISAVFTDKSTFSAIDGISNVPIFRVAGMIGNIECLRESIGEREHFNPTPDSIAIIFSSGTTSRMKAVEITYKSLVLCANRNFEVMNVKGKRLRMTFLMLFPMYHISGLACASGMALRGLSIGTAQSVRATTLVSAIKMFQPVEFGMIPKVHSMFLDKMEEELKKHHLLGLFRSLRHISSFFRTRFHIRCVGRFIMTPFRRALYGKNMYAVLSGGAPCAPEIASEMLDLGVNFVINYSSTECGVPILESGVSINDCYDCVGDIKSDRCVEIKIHDPNENGIGEIYVKSEYIMKGYYNEPELTKSAFEGDWFKTGDNGYIDKRGYLHIAGRSKDSIMLESGKKVSPDDLENMFAQVLGKDTAYSVVGVTAKSAGCDEIHVFIAEIDEAEKRRAMKELLLSWQRAEAPLYPIKKVHFIAELPKTSIGKVKRNVLRDAVRRKQKLEEKSAKAEVVEPKTIENIELTVSNTVARVAGLSETPKGSEDLINEICLDSLTIMELCVELENIYGFPVDIYKKRLSTIDGITEYISNCRAGIETPSKKTEVFNAFEFPKKRKRIHRWLFMTAGKWFEKRIDFKISGLENVKKGEYYIFCPNHQTHMDGLWMWHALGEKRPPIDQIGCMAKMEHLGNVWSRLWLTSLGGIPVNRTGNAMHSFKRSVDFIRAGNSFLIHPEGTRTRDGELGPFKTGAAQMAIDAEAMIIPVAISGGCKVWNYDMTFPRMKDKETGNKKQISITFCEPISPEAGSKEEITELIRKEIDKALDKSSK